MIYIDLPITNGDFLNIFHSYLKLSLKDAEKCRWILTIWDQVLMSEMRSLLRSDMATTFAEI